MRYEFRGPNIVLDPQTVYDCSLLEDKQIGQKLAFTRDTLPANSSQIITGDFIEKDTNPGLGVYQLRVHLDHLLASQSYLSMHAGAINMNGKTLIVSGDSKCGKSMTMHALAECGYVIGDDHIVVGENELRGNHDRRIRGVGRFSNERFGTLHEERQFYLLEFASTNESVNIERGEIMEDSNLSGRILKYSLQPIQRDDRTYTMADLVGEISDTVHILDGFLKDCNEIKLLRGSMDFLVSELQK